MSQLVTARREPQRHITSLRFALWSEAAGELVLCETEDNSSTVNTSCFQNDIGTTMRQHWILELSKALGTRNRLSISLRLHNPTCAKRTIGILGTAPNIKRDGLVLGRSGTHQRRPQPALSPQTNPLGKHHVFDPSRGPGPAFILFVPLCFCVCFRRSRGGACLPLSEFEAENCQCVDVVFGTLLRGGVECFSFFLSCCHRRANTGLNHVVRVSNHMQKKKQRTTTKRPWPSLEA